MRRALKKDYYDYSLIAVILLLMGFGLVMLYSTTSYMAGMQHGSDMYYLKRQAFFAILSIGIACAVSIFDYHLLRFLGPLIYVAASVSVLMTKTPLGVSINGASRWLAIGPISFQPAELSKLAVIICVPMMIVNTGRRLTTFGDVVKPLAAGTFQSALVLLVTSNLSTAIIIFMITLVIIFIAHRETLPFIAGLGALAAIAALFIFLMSRGYIGGFRSRRILAWLDPEKYASSGGYQIMQGLYAMGSGGFLGKGLGNGIQKLGAVPEAGNDMIFSIICEELGLFGGAIVILLFIYLLYRLFFIAQNAPDLFGSLMVAGVFAHIALQVVLNLCVVLNVIPTTGITLPFVSYGGTSVLVLMLEIAIALSVSRKIVFRSPERDLWGDIADNDQ